MLSKRKRCGKKPHEKYIFIIIVIKVTELHNFSNKLLLDERLCEYQMILSVESIVGTLKKFKTFAEILMKL